MHCYKLTILSSMFTRWSNKQQTAAKAAADDVDITHAWYSHKRLTAYSKMDWKPA